MSTAAKFDQKIKDYIEVREALLMHGEVRNTLMRHTLSALSALEGNSTLTLEAVSRTNLATAFRLHSETVKYVVKLHNEKVALENNASSLHNDLLNLLSSEYRSEDWPPVWAREALGDTTKARHSDTPDFEWDEVVIRSACAETYEQQLPRPNFETDVLLPNLKTEQVDALNGLALQRVKSTMLNGEPYAADLDHLLQSYSALRAAPDKNTTRLRELYLESQRLTVKDICIQLITRIGIRQLSPMDPSADAVNPFLARIGPTPKGATAQQRAAWQEAAFLSYESASFSGDTEGDVFGDIQLDLYIAVREFDRQFAGPRIDNLGELG